MRASTLLREEVKGTTDLRTDCVLNRGDELVGPKDHVISRELPPVNNLHDSRSGTRANFEGLRDDAHLRSSLRGLSPHEGDILEGFEEAFFREICNLNSKRGN